MAEVNGTLLILHSLAPCVTFLRFEPSAEKGLAILSMTCYNSEVGRGQFLERNLKENIR